MEYQMICIHLHILQPCDLVHHFQVLHFPGIDILSFILSLNGPIPKIAYYVQASGGISCTSYAIADYVLKSKFSLPWQQGLPERNVTGIVELDVPGNHTIEPEFTTLSYVQPKLWQIFW